jgi:dTDP-4-amino-4,6-dideoxygalactose transaminase
MKVPFFTLIPQFRTIEADVQAAVADVFKTQQFIMGPQVYAFEETIAAYCGSRFGVAVANGSDALLLALMAFGVEAGDEVLMPPFTFFATAGAVARIGAKPVFVDIDAKTFNLDPALLATRITPRTKAIIPVHLYGQCADMDPILEIARSRGLHVIEDAAQAIGATYQPRPDAAVRRAGQIGDVACFSFFPTKNLGAFGDAGMVTTDRPEWAERLRILRVHGGHPKYFHKWVGINSRLDTLQAAILLTKFKHLETWTEERRRKAARYDLLLAPLASAVPGFTLPYTGAGNRHIYHQYVIRVPDREQMRQFLADEGIGTEIYYPVPLHLQECFAYLGGKPGDHPISEAASREVLALPIFPELTDGEQDYVADRIAAFYGR